MWVVESSTPNTSAPSTPLPHQTTHHHHSRTPSTSSINSKEPVSSSSSGAPLSTTISAPATLPPTSQPHSTPITIAHPPAAAHPPHLTTSFPQANAPFQHTSSTPSVSASALPGQNMSGRLTGVVSLTDVLNLFAKATGLHPGDLEEARQKRRRGSSSSSRSMTGVRASLEGVRRENLGVDAAGRR